MYLTNILVLTLGVTVAVGSPFENTDQYIAKFQEGIDNLKKLYETHKFVEKDFDHALYNESEALNHAKEYDFIIVGGGTAGSVIANRLTEIPEWKVLLVEAGEKETLITEIPKYKSLLANTPYNWGYLTTPQKTWCLGMENHQCSLETGKALGGSSAINSMLYARGNVKDYDHWADLGNDGWCYDDVLPYFKKAEDAHLDHFDSKYHSHGGPLHIENPVHSSKLVDHILAAGKEVGLATIDYNGKEQIGLGVPQGITKDGRRNSVAEAYLKPASKRANLDIRPLSQVIEIIIKEHTKEADGVKFLHDGKLYIAKAKKEVILSAGSINTPQLLMLSGVGPKEELEKLGIEVVKDLPVGQNLKDHVGFTGLNFALVDSKLDDESNEKEDLINYLKNHKGPLTSIGHDVIGFIKSKASKDSTATYPDVEILFVPNNVNKGIDHLKHLRVTKETYDSTWKALEGKDMFTALIIQGQPKSTGVLKLKDKDPLHYPLIDTNQLSDADDHDIQTILAGIHKALEIVNAEPLKKVGVHLNEHPVHGCEEHKFGTDDYWKCAIRHLTYSLRHITGTARMGPESDKLAVVDNKLKVYGIQKLRIVDNSVIPVSITGHLMAPAIMIGEKAADLVKADWK